MSQKYKSIFIIAEAGVNHNGDVTTAKELIHAAADAGADAIKFQTFKAEHLVTSTAPKAVYQDKNAPAETSQLAMLKKLELSLNDHTALMDICSKNNIEFLSTPFDLYSIDALSRLGLKRFKIPSGEITNLPYLRKVGSLQKEIILSTGMADIEEVGQALTILTKAGTSLDQITVLHCNTEYPSPMQDVNLKAMQTMQDAFGVQTGYSDHTLGIEVPIAAAALGANVIEKHFTLDKNMEGPDHKASLEPKELAAMVSAIRNIEKAMGDGVKKPTKSEQNNISVVRKSIVASRDIKKGEVFSEENLAVKRPGTGISPMLWDEVVGRKATQKFVQDEIICL